METTTTTIPTARLFCDDNGYCVCEAHAPYSVKSHIVPICDPNHVDMIFASTGSWLDMAITAPEAAGFQCELCQ